jgi:hypothetical protein
MAMNSLWKDHWIYYLRHGNDNQIRGCLRRFPLDKMEGNADGYSACGLLCRVYVERGNCGAFVTDGGFRDAERNQRRCGVPPHVLKEAGLGENDHGVSLGPDPIFSVVALNDGLRDYVPHTFEAIANLIEDAL